MAISHYYVDFNAGNDTTGDGSSGTPWKTIQKALDTITRNSTDGDQINIKDDADVVLTAALSLATYGTPTDDAPLTFRGYTSTANDGGIGGIDGDATYSIIASGSLDYINFIDLHLHNSGSAVVVQLNTQCTFIHCEIDNSSSHGLDLDAHNIVIGCHIHNIGGTGVITSASSLVYANVFENGTNDFDTAINLSGFGLGSNVCFNVVSVDGASDGITGSEVRCNIFNNTVYSNGGTGSGIVLGGNAENATIFNNYVEGFSGSGGIGFEFSSGAYVLHYANNRFYNNATNEDLSARILTDDDNSAVGSSALTAPGSGDFSVGTDLKAGAWPTTFNGISTDQFLDIGAVQREEPAGSGGGGPLIGGRLV